MKLGIFAKTFSGSDPVEILKKASSYGYDGVQYNFHCSGIGSLPSYISKKVLEEVRSAEFATKVEVFAISATYNMIHPKQETREEGKASAIRIINAAKELGIKTVTLCTGTYSVDDMWCYHPMNRSDEAFKELCAEAGSVLDATGGSTVQLGIEPEHGNVIYSAKRAREFLDLMSDERLKIVIDPANIIDPEDLESSEAIICEAVELLGERIVIAHAKDRAVDDHIVAPGQGVVDFGVLHQELKRIGFDGPMITHGLDEVSAGPTAQFLKSKFEIP